MIDPFLKWAGGKRWLVKKHPEFFPKEFNCYYEPFLGSGALYFSINPKKAEISDINKELITTYQTLKSNPLEVEVELKKHALKHSKEYYYKIRNTIYSKPIDIAARMIYLNRTCWNGLYRVNLKGEFNVPKGTKEKVVFPEQSFIEISKYMKKTKILVSDFEKQINKCEKDDFAFLDPPYTIKHNMNGFIKYNEELFSWDDQIRLSEAAIKAHERGAKVVITNANHSSVTSLYKDYFNIHVVSRYSILSGKSEFRNKYEEIVICSK